MVCLTLGVVVPVSAPAYAAAPGADCGTPNDTPPAIFISNWSSCSGTHNGEPLVEYFRRDKYGFAATADDVVTISYSGSCPFTYWSAEGTRWEWNYQTASFLAPKHGTSDATYEDPQFYDLDVVTNDYPNDYWNTCAESGQSTDYSIGVGVTPNTRPTVAFVDRPVSALPDVPFTVTVSGADPEDALQKAHLRVISPGFPTRNLVAPFDGSHRATFTLSLNGAATLEARADDQYNALSATVPHNVALSQDDCGSGADAVSTSVPFASSCRGYLFPGAPGDDLDTYTFETAAGLDRIAIEAVRATHTLTTEVAVTSPSGVVTSGVPPLFLDAEAGTWQVSVARTGTTYGHYDLSTRAIGSPAPPSVAVTASPPDPHQWDPMTLLVSADDPNGEWVSYRVDWGDGTPLTTHPTTGFVPSGPGGQLSHTYAATTAARTVTVTATNQEGQSASTTTTITVRAPDDACVGAIGPAMDAPEEAFYPWTAAQQARFSGRVPRDCRGELGYVLGPNAWGQPGFADAADAYTFSVCAGEAVCPGSATAVNAGRTVEVRVATASALRALVSVGVKGVNTSSAMLTSGSPVTFRFVAVPEVEYRVRLERLTSNGWLWTKGAYDLDVTVDPPA